MIWKMGCVYFSYQLYFVTLDVLIYHLSKGITAYFNEIILNLSYKKYGLRQPVLCLKIIFIHFLMLKKRVILN